MYTPSASVVEESTLEVAPLRSDSGACVGSGMGVAVGTGVGVGSAPPVLTAVSDLKVSSRSYHLSFFRECAATETGVSSATSGNS